MGMKARANVATFFKYFVLILMGFIMVYPLLWMVGSTFKTNAEIFTSLSPFTAHPTLDGYYNAVTKTYGGDITIWRAFLNTYSYVIPKVVFTVISSVIAAYGFSRFKFKGRDFLFGVMIMTLFLPQVVLNVPQYMMYNKFDWINNPLYPALWVPSLFATETYFVYQLVQFMRNVPRDLDEAAAIDGCGPVRTFFLVVLPMLKPTFISVGVLEIMWVWNDFLLPYLVLDLNKYRTIPIVIQYLKGSYGQVDMGATMALILLSIVPVIIFYLCCQKHIIKGVAAGAVKG